MSKLETDIAWVAGLFEGEGTFCIQNESKANGIAIGMTDLDVLNRVQLIYPGRILATPRNNAKPHWKDSWRWRQGGAAAIDTINEILPYLGTRRRQRAEEYILLYNATQKRINDRISTVNRKKAAIRAEYVSGHKTQLQIAHQFNVTRAYVSKVVNTPTVD